MEKYLSVAEMIAIEKAADASGHTYQKMMAQAGASLAEYIGLAHRQLKGKKILGLVGRGNNGGDALVAMSLLQQRGWKTTAYLSAYRIDDLLVEEYVESGGKLVYFSDDTKLKKLTKLVNATNLLIDGLLGTGIQLPLREPIPRVLAAVNQAINHREEKPYVVAVDCPSGVDSDKGKAAEECIPADLTVCMAAVKQGLLKLPAFGLIGKLVVGDIGLTAELPEWARIKRKVLDHAILLQMPPRPLSAHKGTFGTGLVIGGSRAFAGAVLLAGKAAFRVGAGWVNLAVPHSIQNGLIGAFPEATWMPLPDDQGVISRSAAEVVENGLTKETAILIGPGLGLETTTKKFFDRLLDPKLPPMVIDADGLKLAAKFDKWWKRLPKNSILTPHPGEMSILSGLRVSEIQANRVATAERFASSWGHIVVLKGAFTVVAEPGGKTAILPLATPALARAGTGDVLAGIIVGLRAQGMGAFEAACAGVWLHAEAGLLAAEEVGSTAGVLAGDLIEMLPWLLPA
ncbi:MAG: NAD(P)H-hydrate dehydratase [Chloroflexota bacterium]